MPLKINAVYALEFCLKHFKFNRNRTGFDVHSFVTPSYINLCVLNTFILTNIDRLHLPSAVLVHLNLPTEYELDRQINKTFFLLNYDIHKTVRRSTL